MKKVNGNLNLGFGVKVKPTVMREGKIVREYPMMHNLLTNAGLERLATDYVANMFLYAQVGTGTTATMKDSGDTSVTVTKTGQIITASASFFDTANDVGRIIYFKNSGVQATLEADGSNSATQFKCSVSGTEASQECQILFVEQTALATPVKVSNTYRNTGNKENGYDASNNINSEKTGSLTYSSGTITWVSGDTWDSGDVGKLIYSITGNGMARITAVASPTSASVEGTLSTSTNYIIGSYCIIKNWRTFQFSEETGSVTYTEAGWSWANPTSPTDLFGRILFTEQGVAIDLEAGDSLLLYVELDTYIPAAVTSINPLPITNLAVAAKICGFINPSSVSYFSSVSNTGDSVVSIVNSQNLGGAVTEPYGQGDTCCVYLGNSTESIYAKSPTNSTVRAFVRVPCEAYVANSYEKYYVVFFTGASVDLTTDWRTIVFTNYYGDESIGFKIKFDSTQSKTPSNTVQLVFKKSWGRYLG